MNYIVIAYEGIRSISVGKLKLRKRYQTNPEKG
jgi:hypothetical protein